LVRRSGGVEGGVGASAVKEAVVPEDGEVTGIIPDDLARSVDAPRGGAFDEDNTRVGRQRIVDRAIGAIVKVVEEAIALGHYGAGPDDGVRSNDLARVVGGG
jgi:hypothetical protein